MNSLSDIVSDFRRDKADGGCFRVTFHRKLAHSTYLHRQELNSIRRYWKAGRVLNVGAGRDCGKLGDNVESADKRQGTDDYVEGHGWEPIEPDHVFSADESFPFEDNTFDCVMSMHLLEHTVRPDRTFQEMIRVTKVNGVVCGIVPDGIGNPPYNYWRDRTHRHCWTRLDFQGRVEKWMHSIEWVTGGDIQVNLIQYDTMNRFLNPFSIDFAVRKVKRP